jgi:hypothetical protein
MGMQPTDTKRALAEMAAGAVTGGTLGAASGDPEHRTRNFLIGAGLGTGAGAYARPLAQTLRAVGDVFAGSEAYKNFLRDGSSTEGFFVKTPKDAQAVIDKMVKNGVDPKDIINPKSWVDALHFIGSASEIAPRLATYKNVIAEGGSAAEAALKAQDVTLRFANVGAQTKGIASVTPFWNAKVQGWDKLARMAKDPKNWAMGAGMLTAPTIALWSINKDNPEYWQRPIYERNLFWLVPKDGGGFYRIPKPFEIGYLFASLPERMLDYAAQTKAELPGRLLGTDTSAAPETATPGATVGRGLADMATSTFEGTLPLPDAVKMPIEYMANYDMFRNRKIAASPDLPTEAQVTSQTSALARMLAQHGVNPQKADFVLKNVLGTLGGEALAATDILAKAAGADAPETEGIPFARRFGKRFTTSEQGAGETELEARDRLNTVKQARAGLNEVLKSGDQARIQDYAKKYASDLDLADAFEQNGLLNTLDQIARERSLVMKDTQIPKAQKDALLKQYRDASRIISQQIMQVKAPGGTR